MIKSFLKFLKSKDFKEFLILFISGLIIIALCILIYNLPVKAASVENTVYFPMGQNDNGIINSNDIQWFENTFNSGDTRYYVLKFWQYTSNNRYKNIYYVYYDKSSTGQICGEINNNGYQFSFYKAGSVTGVNVGYYMYDAQNHQYYNVRGYGDALSYVANSVSSLYSTSQDYVSNYRVMTSNSDNATTVLKYGWELPPDFFHNDSHATPPDTFQSPVYTTGHTPPTNVPPKYTINNYTWTTYTPPTIDTSNAETLLESIYDAIVYNGQYLKDNIHGELTNLVDNIGGFVEYIGDTIQYYGNLIISNIQNGITTFYNNINSAIVGIGNAVGYITQPLDMDNLTNAVNSTHIWGDIGTCTSYANDAFGIYGTVAEPNTFKIPLDLRSISLLNITQVYYIDLSWLDGAKQAIRAFMWCVVSFGLLYSVIVDIPNMIRSSK